MDTDRLEEFVVLAECLNYAKAAELLFLSQPVLSRHVRELERSLGVSLLARSGREISLTPAGELFTREARSVLNAYHKAMRTLEMSKNNVTGRLTVGVLGSDPEIISAEFIHELDASKRLEVDYISSVTMESLLRRLDRDEVDLIAVDIDSEEARGLELQRITDDGLCAVVSKDHPLYGRASVSVQELSGLPMIDFAREVEPYIADHHRQLFKAHDAVHNPIRLVTNVESGLFYAGLGIGFFLMPKHRTFMAGSLGVIPLSDADAHVTLSLLWKKDRMKPAVAAFVRELSEFYRR